MDNNHSLSIRKGIAWSSIGQIGTQIISFVFGIVLARLLLPSEFGLLAMVMVFTGLADIFKDLGFGAAIIQKKEVSEDDLSTSFWINISIGFLLFFIFYFASNSIAIFYKNSIIGDITKVIAFNFIISSLSATHQSIVLRNFNFKLRAKINIGAIVVGSIVGIILAIYDRGVWALVFLLISKNTYLLLSYWYLVSWRPKFIFSKISFTNLFRFGSIATINSFLSYLNRNSDNLIIGKILGESSLGVYSRVYSIMMLPVRNISNAFKTTLFPVFSKIQDDILEIKRLYIKTTKLVAYVTFPMMFGLSAVSEYFILFLYGDKWIEMVPVLRVLSIFAAFQSLMTFNGTIFYSLGKPKIELIIFMVTTPFLILSFIIGIKINGLIGLSYCYGFISIVFMGYKISFLKKLITLSYYEFIKNIINPILFSTLMYIVVLIVENFIKAFFNSNFIILSILVTVGVVFYATVNYFFAREMFLEVLVMFNFRIKKNRNDDK